MAGHRNRLNRLGLHKIRFPEPGLLDPFHLTVEQPFVRPAESPDQFQQTMLFHESIGAACSATRRPIAIPNRPARGWEIARYFLIAISVWGVWNVNDWRKGSSGPD